MDQGILRRRRRTHSAQFKAEAVTACRRAGISIAAVALERSINANLLRRWIVESERDATGALTPPKMVPAVPPQQRESFVALPLPAQVGDDTPIRIEVRRGAMTLSVHWPRSALHECAVWLREVLK